MMPFEEHLIIPQDVPFLRIKADFHPAIREQVYNTLNTPSSSSIAHLCSQYLWETLCENPNAMDLIYRNPDKISWSHLSKNPNAIELLRQNQDKIDWKRLCLNPNAIQLLEENPSKIYWSFICANPNAINLITRNINHPDINWVALSANPNAMTLLKRFPNRICWRNLSANPSAVEYLKQHPNRIVWRRLCLNPSKEAMEMLEEYMNRPDLNENQRNEICWHNICENPYAIHIIEQELDKTNGRADYITQTTPISSNPEALHLLIPVMENGEETWTLYLHGIFKNPKLDKLLPYINKWITEHHRRILRGLIRSDIGALIYNPAVFTDREYIYEYDAIRLAKAPINEMIHQWAGHPKNMAKWKGWGYMEELWDDEA